MSFYWHVHVVLLPNNPLIKSALLLQTLSRFAADYVASIDGKLTDMPEGELYGGARINWLFTEHFAGCLAKINPLDGLSPNDIRTAIRNATGPRTALFIPEVRSATI